MFTPWYRRLWDWLRMMKRRARIRWLYFRAGKLEEQTCPRSIGQPRAFDPPDHWEPGTLRWKLDREDYWPDGEPMPRCCSYCGGGHPDDLLALLARGWQIDVSTKAYKAYVEPPGGEARRRAIGCAIAGHAEFPHPMPAGPRGVVPPLKLYADHFTKAQIDELNRLLLAQRAADAAACPHRAQG